MKRRDFIGTACAVAIAPVSLRSSWGKDPVRVTWINFDKEIVRAQHVKTDREQLREWCEQDLANGSITPDDIRTMVKLIGVL